MKRFLSILMIVALISGITGCDTGKVEVEEPKEINSFEIYIAKAASVREYGYYDYENLVTEEKPILTGDDIRKYYWDEHIIELKGAYVEKLHAGDISEYSEYGIDDKGYRIYQKGGSFFLDSAQYMAFVIKVNGEKVYSGTFPGSTSMPNDEETIVLGDIYDDRIQIQFSGEGYDVRRNDAVYDYLQAVGMLSEEPAGESGPLVEEMERQLEAMIENYRMLEEKYNMLILEGSGSSKDEAKQKALIEWQKARLELYMIETQEGDRHREFSNLLDTLNPSIIESLGTAADYFRQNAGADVYSNDRMFNVFEEFYDTVIEGIPLYYSMGDINQDFINNARKAGASVSIDKGYVSATPLPSYLKANFELFLSDILNEYLLLRDKELGIILENGMTTAADDENLYIDIEQVADLIYDWKKFSDSYPNNYPFNIKARLNAEELLGIYIGTKNLSVSPLYDNATKEMKKEAKDSYIRFLNEYRDSAYYELIADLFIVLEDSGYRYDSDVENFIENIDYTQYGY